MNVETSLETDAQFAEIGERGLRSNDDPAMPAERVLAFDSTTGNERSDTTLLQVTAAACKVVPFVCVQFARTFARLTAQVGDCGNGIECGLECHGAGPVGAYGRDGQRNAAPAYDDVPFRPELSPICRIGAGFPAPGGRTRWPHHGLLVPNRAGYVRAIGEASRDAVAPTRPQPASPAGVASMSCRCRNRVPVAGPPAGYLYLNDRMPFSASWSLIVQRRPPLGEGVNAGHPVMIRNR